MSVLRTSQSARDILVIKIQNNDKQKTYAMCLFSQFFPGRSYIMGSKNPIRYTSTLVTDLPLCLANGRFSLATVAEGKTIKRAAIPIMGNNSLLSEVYCQNNGLAPNRNKRTDFV